MPPKITRKQAKIAVKVVTRSTKQRSLSTVKSASTKLSTSRVSSSSNSANPIKSKKVQKQTTVSKGKKQRSPSPAVAAPIRKKTSLVAVLPTKQNKKQPVVQTIPKKSTPILSGKRSAKTALPILDVIDVITKKRQPSQKIQVTQTKGKCDVDQFVPNGTQFIVADQSGIYCNFMLNQANVSENNNKFYLGQLLQKGSNEFWTFFRWGRVGVAGQQSMIKCVSKESAYKDFLSKKQAKISGGYTEIFIKYEDDQNPISTKTKKEPVMRKSCTLSVPIQTLINEIFDLKMIEASIKSVGYDQKKIPLGRLEDVTVKAAYTVLKELSLAISAKKTGEYATLSSKFYSLIPHDFGFQKMSNFILKSAEEVQKKITMLQDLTDLKIATQMLVESSSDNSILDDNYKKLNCNIKEITDAKTIKIISDYLKEGAQSYSPKILDIYSVQRKGEAERYQKKIGNDTLLWHGSRISNFAGILSQGLRIAPPEAPSTGYNYGKGIYLADQFAKSCNYCQGNDKGIMYILLIKTALGTPNRIERTDYNANKLPKGTHSCWGWGTNGPPDTITFNGVKVPKGKEVRTASKHWMQYNEFIVYDVNQAQIEYLIRFKPN